MNILEKSVNPQAQWILSEYPKAIKRWTGLLETCLPENREKIKAMLAKMETTLEQTQRLCPNGAIDVK